MSHIVSIQTEVRDPAAVRAACERLKLPPPRHGTFELYGASATGLAIELPGWNFPVICNTAHGEFRYDNFGGHWGDQNELDRFLQAYAVEKAKIEARRRGHSGTEQPLQDGSIKLTIQVEGAV